MRRKNSRCLEIALILFFLIPLARAEINFNYPQSAEYGKVFSVSLETVNLSGTYDVKIDALNSSNDRVMRILNSSGQWQSTIRYVNNAINTSVSNSSEFSMNMTEKYNGSAIINITLRYGPSSNYKYFKFGPYNILAIYSPISSQKNITNATNTTIQDNSTIQTEQLSGYNYTIIELPSDLAEDFIVKLKITNNENTTNFEAWSYVYSGSVCYSDGGRESNKINVTLEKFSSKVIELQNKINFSDIDQNKSYKLKIKILREGLKTAREFTYDLAIPAGLIKPAEENVAVEAPENSDEESAPVPQSSEEVTIKTYESESMPVGKIAVYIFAGLMTLFSIYLIAKKG